MPKRFDLTLFHLYLREQWRLADLAAMEDESMPDNSITLVGNLSRSPELRFTPSGQATANFGLAVNRRWQNRQTQEWEEQVSFFDVVCWREMAENVAESLEKGARVVVTGRLAQRSWETENGEKRSKVEVTADEIGPSLRWSTAQVTKNERRGPGDRPAVAGPVAAPSQVREPSASRPTVNPTGYDPTDPDSEPF